MNYKSKHLKHVKINGYGVEHFNINGTSANHDNEKEEDLSELTPKYSLRERTKMNVKCKKIN